MFNNADISVIKRRFQYDYNYEKAGFSYYVNKFGDSMFTRIAADYCYQIIENIFVKFEDGTYSYSVTKTRGNEVETRNGTALSLADAVEMCETIKHQFASEVLSDDYASTRNKRRVIVKKPRSVGLKPYFILFSFICMPFAIAGCAVGKFIL